MTAMTLLAFAAVALIAIATPGPTMLLALTNGSRFGVRRAGWGMAGAVVSDLLLVGAVALGLGALLAASEFWFSVVKWVGVAYLAFLGVRLLRSRGGLDAAEVDAVADGGRLAGAGSGRALFLRCFLVAVTNPKGYLFVTALLPQFIAPAVAQAPQYLALALVFAGLDLAMMALYALLGARAMRLLKQRGALWLDRICGSVFLALAGSLALYRRTGA